MTEFADNDVRPAPPVDAKALARARELQRLTVDDSQNEPPDFPVDDGFDDATPDPVEADQEGDEEQLIPGEVRRAVLPMLTIPLPEGTDITIVRLEGGGRRLVVGPVLVSFVMDFADADACAAIAREFSGGIEIASGLDHAVLRQAERLERKGR